MKRLIEYTLALVLIVSMFPAFVQTAQAADGFRISFTYFHHRLSPYGRWVYVPRYGRVWYPSGLGPRWQPYSYGYWTYTQYGWTWVSYYEWGGIPFHYGAWDWVPGYGWVWVPGYVWAPAWVTWRYGPSIFGWAPLPPGYGFRYGAACPHVTVIERAWVFVPARYIGTRNLYPVRIAPYRNSALVRSTRSVTNISVVKNYVVNAGPSASLIERTAKVRVRRANVRQLGLAPQPLRSIKQSHRITVTTPFRSRSVKTAPISPQSHHGERLSSSQPYSLQRAPTSPAAPYRVNPTVQPSVTLPGRRIESVSRRVPEQRQASGRQARFRTTPSQRRDEEVQRRATRSKTENPRATRRPPTTVRQDRARKPTKVPRRVLRSQRKTPRGRFAKPMRPRTSQRRMNRHHADLPRGRSMRPPRAMRSRARTLVRRRRP